MIWPILEARAEIQKYFIHFLVQMKTSKSHSEIIWPLEVDQPFVFYMMTLMLIYSKHKILTLFLWILGPLLPKRLGKHSMITIDEGKAVILGGYCPNDQQQHDQNAIHLLTCSNQNCKFEPFELMMSAPRQDFVAIPLPEDAECTFDSTTEMTTDLTTKD